MGSNLQHVDRIAADIGGTFTDIAVITNDQQLLTRKLPSTPANYADAVVKGITAILQELGSPPGALLEVLHGCTVATNAILERKGARIALLTTRWFRDVLELQRIRVPALYQPLYERPKPLVPRDLRFEITERITAKGEVLTPLSEEEVINCAEKIKALEIEAVAVCYLNSYANPVHENRTSEILRDLLGRIFISVSTEVLPQIREYERTSTTVVNAYVGPLVKHYMDSMVQQLTETGLNNARLMVMQSSGGILDSNAVIEKPAQIIECGPAAGVIGAQFLSTLTGYENLITLDMGGTTAKASLIEKGQLSFAEEYEVGGEMSAKSALLGGGGYALKLPVIDISEVGAGGGSIAWLDKVGSLKVGPKSAGAVPGPACYALGNDRPTVTDANVVLGYLNPESLAGNSIPIRSVLSHNVIDEYLASPLSLGLMESAFGVHQVANSNMMRAVKAVTTLRGRDPRDFSMLAFGGSGGVHAVDLAKSLQIQRVIMPLAAGVYSALGLLWSNLEVNETLPFLHLVSDFLIGKAEEQFFKLEERISRMIGVGKGKIVFQRKVDARFLGQAYELTIKYGSEENESKLRAELFRNFEEEHLLRYGHAFSGEYPVELVNLRVIGARRPENQVPPRFQASRSKKSSICRKAYFGPTIGMLETTVMGRKELTEKPVSGPLIIEEYEGTAVIPPDCNASIDGYGNIIINVNSE